MSQFLLFPVKADKNPAWSRYEEQNKDSNLFDGVFWNPEHPYKFKHEQPSLDFESLLIYECHVGMSSEEGKVSSYTEFTDNVLPRIKANGYNCIQIMAI